MEHLPTNVPERFSIPKVKRSPNKGCRHVLELDSRLAKDIIRHISNPVLDQQVKWKEKWSLNTISQVINQKLQQRFIEKKQELRELLSKEPAESFAFGLTEWDHEADAICSRGDFSRQCLNVPLGSVDQGVNVCLYPEVLLQWAEKKCFQQPCIIIYKILKGRCKAIPARTSVKEPCLEPTPNVECHISHGVPNSSEPLFRQLSKSQIFLFEYDEEALPSKHPRHCLPYAVITLSSRSTETGLPPHRTTSSTTATATALTESTFGKEMNAHLPTKQNTVPKQNKNQKGYEDSASPKSRRNPSKIEVSEDLYNPASNVPKKKGSKNPSSSEAVSKRFDGDGKENGIQKVTVKEHEAVSRGSETSTNGARMKLSDRFANFNPSYSKLDDPRLEELRQEHLKALEKLQAVRVERLNNAMLGFGSSSEDEQLSAAQSLDSCQDLSASTTVLHAKNESQRKAQKKCRMDESQVLESDSNKPKPDVGGLKITIINATHASKSETDFEINNRVSPSPKQENSRNERYKSTMRTHMDEGHPRRTDQSRSKDMSERKGKHDTQQSRYQSKSKRYFAYSPKPFRAKLTTQRFLPEDCRSFQRSKFSRRPPRRGFGRFRGRGRGRLLYKCTEYFKSDDASHLFDVEEELYGASSTVSTKTHTSGHVEDPSPKKRFRKTALAVQGTRSIDDRMLKQNNEEEHKEPPFIRLQSLDHSSNRSDECRPSQFCNSTEQNALRSPDDTRGVATCTPILSVSSSRCLKEPMSSDLATYQNSLILEDISDEETSELDAVDKCTTAPTADNMDVQDMDIEEGNSRDCWSGESLQHWSFQNDPNQASVSSFVTPQETHAGVGQVHPIRLSVESLPTGEAHSFSAHGNILGGAIPTNYGISASGEQDSSAMNTNRLYTEALVGSSLSVQEVVRILVQQMQLATTADQKAVLQIALQGFLQRCASDRNSSHPQTTPIEDSGETSLMPDGSEMGVSATYLNNKLILKEVAKCLNHKRGNKEQSSKQSSLSKKSSSNKETAFKDPKKTKTRKDFHGRPLITNGEPHKILLHNIPGQPRPVDPRAALSALFGRKYEIDLKTVNWGSDSEESKPSNGESEDCPESEDANITISDRDPRLMKNQSSKTASSPPHPSCQSTEPDLVAPRESPDVNIVKSEHLNPDDHIQHPDSNLTTQLLQKLQHVSCLNIAATRPEPRTHTRQVSCPQPEQVSRDGQTRLCTTAQESANKQSRVRVESRRRSSESSCSSNSSSGFSPGETHELVPSPKSSPFQRGSPHMRKSPDQRRSPMQNRSPKQSRRHRSRSPRRSASPVRKSRSRQRTRFSHRSRSPKCRSRSPHQIRSRDRGSSSRSGDHCRQKSPGRDDKYEQSQRHSVTLLNVRASLSEHFSGLSNTDTYSMTGFAAELFILRNSTHKAMQKMSRFQTSKTTFRRTCSPFLRQYNDLWLKASEALTSLKNCKAAAAEHEKHTFEAGIAKYEEMTANIHVQLESLVHYFHAGHLDVVGIQDWNFRPLSGVPGLSEREHLNVLQRLQHMYKQLQNTGDLLHVVGKKINLLETKLRSGVCAQSNTIPSFNQSEPAVFGYIAPEQAQQASLIPSSVQHGHSNITQFQQPVTTHLEPMTSVSNLQQHSLMPEQNQDIRRVVMKNSKPESHRDVDQQGFETPSPAPQNSDFMQRNN